MTEADVVQVRAIFDELTSAHEEEDRILCAQAGLGFPISSRDEARAQALRAEYVKANERACAAQRRLLEARLAHPDSAF